MAVNTQPRYAPARVHGLQSPLSRDQVGAIILYPILTAAFYLIASYYLPSEQIPLILGLYSALVVISVACWFYVEFVDPSQPGGFPCPCMKFTQSHSRYCATCKKTVPGLDHHCLWLNTCIGSRNYFFFFILALSGTAQFTLQTAVSILLLTYWVGDRLEQRIKDTVGRGVHYDVLMIIHTIAAAIALLSFSSLCVFHSYLQVMGMGTYDWILSKRTPNPSTTTARPGTSTLGKHAQTSTTGGGAATVAGGGGVNGARAAGGSAAAGGGGVTAPSNGKQQGGGSASHVFVEIPPGSSSSSMSQGGSSISTIQTQFSDQKDAMAVVINAEDSSSRKADGEGAAE